MDGKTCCSHLARRFCIGQPVQLWISVDLFPKSVPAGFVLLVETTAHYDFERIFEGWLLGC